MKFALRTTKVYLVLLPGVNAGSQYLDLKKMELQSKRNTKVVSMGNTAMRKDILEVSFVMKEGLQLTM